MQKRRNSSGGSAGLASLPGGSGGAGFIGFSSFAANGSTFAAAADANAGSVQPAARPLPPFYDGTNSDLAMLFKRLTKKDPTTKLKALSQLQNLCSAAASAAEAPQRGTPPQQEHLHHHQAFLTPDDVIGLVPHWVYIYARLALDNDRRVRESANATLSHVAAANRKAVVPFLRQLLGPWWICMADPASEVAGAAKRAFEAAFPSAKRRATILAQCHADILTHIAATLGLAPEALSDMTICTVDEATERYDRVITSCLGATGQLLSALAADAAAAAAAAAAQPTDLAAMPLTEADADTIAGVLRKWLRDKRPAFRRSACQLLCACCEAAPQLLLLSNAAAPPQAAAAAASASHAAGLAPVVLGLVTEPEPSNHPAAWSALLLFLRAYPSALAAPQTEKLLLRPLLARLRSGAFLPSAASSYASVLPLLAVLPNGTLAAYSGGGFGGFAVQLLDILWGGIAAAGTDVAAAATISGAHAECAAYLLVVHAASADGSSGGAADSSPRAAAPADAMRDHVCRALDAWMAEPGGLVERTRGSGAAAVAGAAAAAAESLARGLAQLQRGSIAPALWESLADSAWEWLRGASAPVATWAAELLSRAHALAAEAAERREIASAALAAAAATAPDAAAAPAEPAAAAAGQGAGLVALCRALFARCLEACEEATRAGIAPLPPLPLLLFAARVAAAVSPSLLTDGSTDALCAAVRGWITAAEPASPALPPLLDLLRGVLRAMDIGAASPMLSAVVCELLERAGGVSVAALTLRRCGDAVTLARQDRRRCVDEPVIAVAAADGGDVQPNVIAFVQTCFGFWDGAQRRPPLVSKATAAQLCEGASFSPSFVAAALPMLAHGGRHGGGHARSATQLLANGACALLQTALDLACSGGSGAAAARALWRAHAVAVLRNAADADNDVGHLWEMLSQRCIANVLQQLRALADAADGAGAPPAIARCVAVTLELLDVQLMPMSGVGILSRLGVAVPASWQPPPRTAAPAAAAAALRMRSTLWTFTEALLMARAHDGGPLELLVSATITPPWPAGADPMPPLLWGLLRTGVEVGGRRAPLTLEAAAQAAAAESRRNSGAIAAAMGADFGASCLPRGRGGAAPYPSRAAALLLPQSKADDLYPLPRFHMLTAWELGVQEVAQAAAAAAAAVPSDMGAEAAAAAAAPAGAPADVASEAAAALAACALGPALAHGVGRDAPDALAAMAERLARVLRAAAPLTEDAVTQGSVLRYVGATAAAAAAGAEGGGGEEETVTVVAVHADPAGGEAYVTVRHADGRERQTVLSRLRAAGCSEERAAAASAALSWRETKNVAISMIAAAAAARLLREQLLPLEAAVRAGDGDSETLLAALCAAAPACIRIVAASPASEECAPLLLELQPVWEHWSAAAAAAGEDSAATLDERLRAAATAAAVMSALFAGTPYMRAHSGDVKRVLEALDGVLSEAHMYEEAGSAAARRCEHAALTLVADALQADSAGAAVAASASAGVGAPLGVAESITMTCCGAAAGGDGGGGGSASAASPELLRAIAACLACEAGRIVRGGAGALSPALKRAAVELALPRVLAAAAADDAGAAVPAAELRSAALSVRLITELAADDHCVVRDAAEARALWAPHAAPGSATCAALYRLMQRNGAPALQACAYHVLAAAAACAEIAPPDDGAAAAAAAVPEGQEALEREARAAEERAARHDDSVARRCVPPPLLALLGGLRARVEVDLLGAEDDEECGAAAAAAAAAESGSAPEEGEAEGDGDSEEEEAEDAEASWEGAGEGAEGEEEGEAESAAARRERHLAYTHALPWLLFLRCVHRADACEDGARASLSATVARLRLLAPLLHACFHLLHDGGDGGRRSGRGGGGGGGGGALTAAALTRLRVAALLGGGGEAGRGGTARLATLVYFRTVLAFPALVRAWWTDACARRLQAWVEHFTRRHVTPAIIAREIAHLSSARAGGRWDSEGLAVRASEAVGEVVATYVKDESELSMTIRLPPSYPLRAVEVSCARQLGIGEARWRRWVLQIVTLLSVRDGSVLDAVLLWKRNVDKEFEGMEPCVICYSTLHPRDMALPTLACRTCSNRFHPSCLYKWFQTSHKSKCPLCQQTWA